MSQQPIPVDVSKLLNRSTALKTLAVALVGYAGWLLTGTAPKMASSAGAPVNEVIGSILPAIGGVVAWIVANWSKVSPDMVQALVALVKNPQDVTAWIRVLTGLAVILKQAKPDSPALAKLIEASRAFHDELQPDKAVEVKAG